MRDGSLHSKNNLSMARPRNILMGYFPPGTITAEQASDALRQAGGDLDFAKKILQAKLKEESSEKRISPRTVASDAKQDTGAVSKQKEGSDAAFPAERVPPRSVASINNLSDRQYCCVWHVEVFEDGYRPQVARALLAKVARHVNPILRDRGWRVKRLMESSSRTWIGCCTGNGRDDADAASANIQLNLRVQPNKHCQVFRSFESILGVMLHEITHISIGLEDIHPPAFYELLNEIRGEYRAKLENGEVAQETDDYGCNNAFVTVSGEVATVSEAASGVVQQEGQVPLFDSNEECGAKKKHRRRWRGRGTKRSAGKAMGTVALQKQEKRRPLLKGAKMIDKRTKVGKAAMAEQASVPARELAARAALARFGNNATVVAKEEHEDDIVGESDAKNHQEASSSDEDGEDDDDESSIASHDEGCECRSCEWEKVWRSETCYFLG